MTFVSTRMVVKFVGPARCAKQSPISLLSHMLAELFTTQDK